MKNLSIIALRLRLRNVQNDISMRNWNASALGIAGVVFGAMTYCKSGCTANHPLHPMKRDAT